ncbi:MAG TPA: TetR family transcriptional regulator [Mucilaginibacter sp.]|nr:TetR family transcriptional regulator [Mucilaginibacter sp.]
MTETRIDISTEEKIKEAARIVFTRKGYAAAKVRDIAAEADINLALVNYYFRSKEKLFEIIMTETIQGLFEKIQPIINNELTTVSEKLEGIVDHYIDLLLENPYLPLFVVNELMSGSDRFPKMTNNGNMFLHSHLFKQLWELRSGKKIEFHPVNIMMNMLGMIIMPFLARPLILRSGALKDEEFRGIIEQRKKLIPLWLNMMMNL